MKKIHLKFVFLLCAVVFVSSCANKITKSELLMERKIDNRLVGIWQGSEEGKQIKNTKKEWEINRKPDGTQISNFKAYNGDEVVETEETGVWWVKGDRFFEKIEGSEKPDEYFFTVLDKDQVQFKMIKTDINFEDPNYTFVDTRKVSKDSIAPKQPKAKKDGLSLETAIKVKSIAEEYKFARQNCPSCEMQSQALLHHNQKPYDKLILKNEKGETVSYYFDISSFYGKW